ncbi:MAG: hypothetical protein ACKPH3_18185, partial [Dolichospermum sp.]
MSSKAKKKSDQIRPYLHKRRIVSMNFNNYNTGGIVADNSSEWKEVSKNNPCPLCGKPDWCSVSS